MSDTAVATPPLTQRGIRAYEAAKRRWDVANKIERIHKRNCFRVEQGRRCGDCLNLEAAQNRAADAVTRARRAVGMGA